MGIIGKWMGIVGKLTKFEIVTLHKERKRERERCINALRNWFILSLISNVELQLCIYMRLALISLAHIAQDNWLINSTCAL